MSISDAINNAKSKISSAYDALAAKGAPMPVVKDLSNMVSTVQGIPNPDFYNTFKDWSYEGTKGYLNITSYVGTGSSAIVPSQATLLKSGIFQSKANLQNVDLQHIPFYNNDMSNMFEGCSNLTSISNMDWDNATNMYRAFKGCSALYSFAQSGPMWYTLSIPAPIVNGSYAFSSAFSLGRMKLTLPYSSSLTNMSHMFEYGQLYELNFDYNAPVTDMSYTFYNCQQLQLNSMKIPRSVTNLAYAFCGIPKGPVNILSNQVTDVTGIREGASSNFNISIPYNYSGTTTRTKTFNTFKSAGYVYANGTAIPLHGIYIEDNGMG